MEVHYNKRLIFSHSEEMPVRQLKVSLSNQLTIPFEHFYLIKNGKLVGLEDIIHGPTQIVLRQVGGKGGFGSMLRAIGAQIEKTTNREACRDLSGRRLRDINEEQRLKNWISAQAEREKEAAEKKQKKLERLCEQPKHEFKDESYDKLRSDLPEKVEDAVTQGLKASCSGKRKHEQDDVIKNKRKKLWFDEDMSSSSGDDDDDSDDPSTEGKPDSVSHLVVKKENPVCPDKL